MKGPLSLAHLDLDAPAEIERLAKVIRDQVSQQLRRRGAVLGISGGIDSSVVAALCVRALGPKRVVGLLMPEAESSPDSLRLGRLLADSLGIETVLEDITPILKGARCYERRDEAIRGLIPQYDETYKCKIVLPSLAEGSGYALFSVVVESPTGAQTKARLAAEAYREIVAATSFKQRARKMMEYYHADRLQYAVVGTPNRLEYDQGFFVKNGDGAADLKPIAHLHKRQVYQLAAELNIPEEIQRRPPTTDTYSLEQSQEEFYFSLPLDKFDLCLYAKDHDVTPEVVAEATGLTAELVTRIYRQIESKRMATRYLHLTPLLAREGC
jgi:NAD+ synthase